MNPFWWLFGLGGRIGRGAFLLGVIVAAALFWAAIHYSLAALPQMAEVLAPKGINAAFALNTIWIVAGVLLLWSLIALTAKRLRHRGQWPWWGALGFPPLAAELLLNDWVFLASRYVKVPAPLQYAIVASAGIVALCVLVECFMPARGDEDHGDEDEDKD